MKKTVTYCRTAFAEPSDPLAGVSAQAASLRQYAGQHGMTVDGTYMDAGESGVTLIRPALQQLLADCGAGRIGVVVRNFLGETHSQVYIVLQFRKLFGRHKLAV
jgi:DNA invertase Pin-like site-specific DNA recombinase